MSSICGIKMPFQCHIVSAEQAIFSGEAEALVATGELGELGIHPGHSPLLTALQPGPVKLIRSGGEGEFYYVSGGYLEVQPDSVTILADTAVRAANIDEAAAATAQEKAEKLLFLRASQKPHSDFEFKRALAELAEASARLRTLRRYRRERG